MGRKTVCRSSMCTTKMKGPSQCARGTPPLKIAYCDTDHPTFTRCCRPCRIECICFIIDLYWRPWLLAFSNIGVAWPTNLGLKHFTFPTPSSFPTHPHLLYLSLLRFPSLLLGVRSLPPENFLASRLLYMSFGAFSDEINVSLMRRFVRRKICICSHI
jgi:hypothetical protein